MSQRAEVRQAETAGTADPLGQRLRARRQGLNLTLKEVASRAASPSDLNPARSGESEDVSISHIATGLGCNQLKVGSFTRSERMAKWNECLRIEEALGKENFAGGTALASTWWRKAE